MATQTIPQNARYRISAAAMSELETAWKNYRAAVAASDLSKSSQATHIDMANNFVRWLRVTLIPALARLRTGSSRIS